MNNELFPDMSLAPGFPVGSCNIAVPISVSMDYCSRSVIDQQFETIVIGLHDSGYSLQHAQARHEPVLGLEGACADRVQPRMGMRGPAGPGGVTHCEVTQHVNGVNNPRMNFVNSLFYYHLSSSSINFSQ